MNRRTFIRRSLTGIALIGGTGIHAVSNNRYASLISKGISLRFAIASDGHYGQPGTDFEAYHADITKWLNAEHERHALDFSLFNGDLIHDDPGFLANVRDQYQSLRMPFHVSRGNHDRCTEKHWQETWGHALNYSFTVGSSAFVVLDTSNEKGDYLCPDLDLTRDELQKHASSRHLFVFMHITPLKWTDNGISCARLSSLFSKQKNLRGVFHGHDHDQDYVKIHKGTRYFFDGHLGGNWGTDYRGYRIVEVTNDGAVLTYQVNPANQSRVNSTDLAQAKTH